MSIAASRLIHRRTVVLLAVAALAAVPAADAKTVFVLKGRGWGHAVGMSQWGAYGHAKQGWGYARILRHYYTGTTIGTRSGTRVGVLLAGGRTRLRIGSTRSFKVEARTHAAGFPLVTMTRRGRIKVRGFRRAFASPVTFAPLRSFLQHGSTRYRGRIVVRIRGGRLRAVNRVGLEGYLRGVVPRESPSWWPAAALRAQAVAARSYARFGLAHGGGRCGGSFCADTRDQVYGGVDAETASTNRAVAATTRKVVLYSGSAAQAFFSSSNGGRSASARDTWGSSVPYLQSVADRADLNADNPNRFWRELRTARQMRRMLGLQRRPRDGTAQRNASGRVSGLRFTGPGWVTPVQGGDSLRWNLNIRSNRFRLGVLSLRPQKHRVVFGSRVHVNVLVRNLPHGRLGRRPYGASGWTRVTRVSGAKRLSLEPHRGTTYRLRGGRVGIRERVKVAARINFAGEQTTSRLGGIVRPRSLAGRTVVVQRRAQGAWRLADTATVASNGSWRARFAVRPGVYRAVVTPRAGSGLVRGVSPRLTVVAG